MAEAKQGSSQQDPADQVAPDRKACCSCCSASRAASGNASAAQLGSSQQAGTIGVTKLKTVSKSWVYIFRFLRACTFLVNVRTIALSALACMMVYLVESDTLKLKFRIEFSILSTGTVFPLCFSIQQAFTRREEALRTLSVLKGALLGLYFCNRDWDVIKGYKNEDRKTLGDDGQHRAMECADKITNLLIALRDWLSSSTPYESEAEGQVLYAPQVYDIKSQNTRFGWWLHVSHLWGVFFNGKEGRMGCAYRNEPEDRFARTRLLANEDLHWSKYFNIICQINCISIFNERLMAAANCQKAGEGGMSRLADYVAKTAESVERLRFLRDYRTPFMLRYVTFTLVVASIVLASPYFAFMCKDTRWEKDTSGICPAGYFTAILYVLVLSTLFHVQVALENPFDGIGMDDIINNMDAEFVVTIERFSTASNAAGTGAGVSAGAAVGAAAAASSSVSAAGSSAAAAASWSSAAGSGSAVGGGAASRTGAAGGRGVAINSHAAKGNGNTNSVTGSSASQPPTEVSPHTAIDVAPDSSTASPRCCWKRSDSRCRSG